MIELHIDNQPTSFVIIFLTVINKWINWGLALYNDTVHGNIFFIPVKILYLSFF